MRIKHDKEKDYADFTAAQNTNPGGQAMVRFIETWSGMMECVMEQGASDVTEAAALTVQAAADAAGITRDEDVVAGAARLENFHNYQAKDLEPLLEQEKPLELLTRRWMVEQDVDLSSEFDRVFRETVCQEENDEPESGPSMT